MKLLFLAAFLLLIFTIQAQTITTIAGIGTTGYSGDGGPASSAQFDHPYRAILDNFGNMYIADMGNHVVRKINSEGIVTTIAGIGVVGYSGDAGPATNAKMSKPIDLAFDAIGNLFVAEWGNNVIRKISTSGMISTVAGTGYSGYSGDGGPATNAKLNDPFGLIFDHSGNLIFADNANARIRKIDLYGSIFTIAGTGTWGFSGDGGPASAAKIFGGGFLAINLSRELVIADYFNHRIRTINASGIIHTLIGNGVNANTGDGGPASAATLSENYGVFCDNRGNMYISDRWALIRKVDAAGIITTIAGSDTLGFAGDGGPATAAKFGLEPLCSAIDALGNLYISDPNNNRIRKITSNNTAVNQAPALQQEITISPNPARNELTITSSQKLDEVVIKDVLGNIVNCGTFTGVKAVINISGLPVGQYFVTVGGVFAGRFVKE